MLPSRSLPRTVWSRAAGAPLPPLTPSLRPLQLFPLTVATGFGDGEDLERQRRFLALCFPELHAAGLLMDPSRTKIKAAKECACLVLFFAIVLAVVLWWRHLEQE